MGAVRIIVLAVAAVAAIALAFVVHKMTSGHPAAPAPVVAAAPDKPSVQVLVAKRDLPTGTRLAPADLAWQTWPADSLNPAFITDGSAPIAPPKTVAGKAEQVAKSATSALSGGGAMQNLTGAIVREPILANEPVVERKIVRGGEGGYMSVVLQPGMRAMAVEVNATSGAGGFILPGDRVDVLMSRKLEGRSSDSGAGRQRPDRRRPDRPAEPQGPGHRPAGRARQDRQILDRLHRDPRGPGRRHRSADPRQAGGRHRPGAQVVRRHGRAVGTRRGGAGPVDPHRPRRKGL